MAGFPDRPDRDAFGPTYENERPVENPKRELGEDVVNLNMWQVAGMGGVSPKVVIAALVPGGGPITVSNQRLAWDPNQGVANITINYIGAGQYTFAFASTYPDENGISQSTDLIGGVAAPNSLLNVNGVLYMSSGYQGIIKLFDADAGTPIDAHFTMIIW